MTRWAFEIGDRVVVPYRDDGGAATVKSRYTSMCRPCYYVQYQDGLMAPMPEHMLKLDVVSTETQDIVRDYNI